MQESLIKHVFSSYLSKFIFNARSCLQVEIKNMCSSDVSLVNENRDYGNLRRNFYIQSIHFIL